ncbi:MAG: hypothetical protein IPN36_11115 [Bacteroidetes bacterium]|nr:hypothetical protein [Bacteroidota bacterium]
MVIILLNHFFWFTPPPNFSVGIEKKWSELMLPGNDQDYYFKEIIKSETIVNIEMYINN